MGWTFYANARPPVRGMGHHGRIDGPGAPPSRRAMERALAAAEDDHRPRCEMLFAPLKPALWEARRRGCPPGRHRSRCRFGGVH